MTDALDQLSVVVVQPREQTQMKSIAAQRTRWEYHVS
jgi:hypothetical protein